MSELGDASTDHAGMRRAKTDLDCSVFRGWGSSSDRDGRRPVDFIRERLKDTDWTTRTTRKRTRCGEEPAEEEMDERSTDRWWHEHEYFDGRVDE